MMLSPIFTLSAADAMIVRYMITDADIIFAFRHYADAAERPDLLPPRWPLYAAFVDYLFIAASLLLPITPLRHIAIFRRHF